MHFPQLALALLATTAATGVQGAKTPKRQAASPSVSIGNGVVIGTTTQYQGAQATNNKFLGIPFAKSPPLRFGLPEPAPTWSAPLQATTYKPACLQQPGYGNPTLNGQSEDCLYINVYSPAGSNSSSKKTVMVWFYGGNLQAGDASLATYDGSEIAANQDVIVVSFGYRVNVFGFSNSPEIPTSQQNVGFYDQRQALNWVQTNIGAFGGDPTKVTIFGQSAGGYSIKNLIAFPPSPLPYRAAIMESEALSIPGNGVADWNTLALALGCLPIGQLACVRSKSALQIQGIVNATNLGFAPANDGVTFTPNVLPRFQNGQAAKVPVILGSNGAETAALFGSVADPGQTFGQAFPSVSVPSFVSGALVADGLDRVLTDVGFTCPVSQLAQTLQSSGYPTWRYYYNASFADTSAYPGEGAYHTAEIFEVFGSYPHSSATPFENALSQYMQSNWANFAKQPSGGPAWPEYGTAMNVANLGSNGVIENTIPASSVDQLCPIANTLSNAENLLETLTGGNLPATADGVFNLP